MRLNDLARLSWHEHPDNPLLRPPFLSPLLADPTFLPPAETPDGRWHLFAHSLFGIHHYVSADGLSWKREGATLVRNALRAFLLRDGDTYRLYYEKCRLMLPIVPLPWVSHVEVRSSPDLVRWSAPEVVLRPSLPWHHEPGRGSAVSNPCVVRAGGGFRLYYSAGLVFLPDCGFCEPRFIGLAEADSPLGPFRPSPEPLFGPTPERWCNAGAGSMKVVALEDGFAGFQNGIYLDEAGRSGSAIRLLGSQDGRAFTPLREEPIIAPSTGWKRSHVYALDVRQVDGRWILFFNARNTWHWTRGREAIGRADGVAGQYDAAP